MFVEGLTWKSIKRENQSCGCKCSVERDVNPWILWPCPQAEQVSVSPHFICCPSRAGVWDSHCSKTLLPSVMLRFNWMKESRERATLYSARYSVLLGKYDIPESWDMAKWWSVSSSVNGFHKLCKTWKQHLIYQLLPHTCTCYTQSQSAKGPPVNPLCEFMHSIIKIHF